MSQDHGLEDAAILMMSLGEAEASEVFKHLSPKEVQKLGEAIAKTISVTRERVDEIVGKFTSVAASHWVTTKLLCSLIESCRVVMFQGLRA